LDPNFTSAYNNRCAVNNDLLAFDRAIADCSVAIRRNPKLSNAFNNRAYFWNKKGEFDRAIADFNQAILLDAKNVLSYVNRGDSWQLKGEFDRAIADYSEAIRLDPKVPHSYGSRGMLRAQQGDFERAFADLDETIRLDPKGAAGYSNRALAWRYKGDYDGAMADINEAFRLELDEHLKDYAGRGEIWRLKGDLDRALSDQNEAIRLYDPSKAGIFELPSYYVARGDTYRYMGDFDRALGDYNEALREVPDFIPALGGRGLTYEKMDNLAQAREEFAKALASHSALRAFKAKSALETAKAHLAALDSGAPLPVIPTAPVKVTSETSIPTPIVAVPAPVAAAPAVHQRRVALVIGNSTYQNVPVLPNPQHDADKVASTLRAIGFDTVTLANNANHQSLIEALHAFADAAEQADWAVVYYAGHGIEVSGVNYLIPVDAKLAVDRDVEFEAVPLDRIMTALEGAKKLKLILLDACRDNPFAPSMRRTAAPAVAENRSTGAGIIATRSVGCGLADVKVSGATLVVYAAKGGQVALDGEGENSPFAVAVIQRMATPGVEINKVFRLVRDDVMEATAGRQEPYTYGSLPAREDFYFVQK
jgi:tetratricopeptide (TPR) repeat protein